MRKFMTMTFLGLGLIALVGCTDDDIILNPRPAAPQGVLSVTADQAVYIYWNGPYEADISEYIIYRSGDDVTYTELDRVAADGNPNLDLVIYEYIDGNVVNGSTYFYAVETVDLSGQVSGLSAELVFDTPRPEGTVTLFSADISASQSGFLFSAEQVVDNSLADIFLQTIEEELFISARLGGTFIMDMGLTETFDDISYSPSTETSVGWSNFFDVELIEGHTYVIWMTDGLDNNFAKMRAVTVGSTNAYLQWAYQTDQGNPELKPAITVASGNGQ